ncbi:MAG: hypothetical protein ABJK20_06510 [Halieaceae bacterium]
MNIWTFARSWPIWACVLLLWPGLAFADESAAPYGESFVRVGKTWVDAAPPVSVPDVAAQTAADRDEYQGRLAEMEYAEGPYSDQLAEPLLGLARYHRSEGDLEAAQALYQRALHLVRVNDGLYSERQVPLVRELLQLYRDAGDFQALDRRYDYFFRLYGSGRPPYTDLRLQATLEYLRWQREALRSGLDESGEQRRLLALYELNRDVLEMAMADPAVNSSMRMALGLSQLRNLYLLQDKVQPAVESLYGVNGNRAAPNYPGGELQDFNTTRLRAMRQTALARGRSLLTALLEEQPGIAVRDRARLHLELGDWYQWNRLRPSAMKHYRSAFDILSGAGEEELLSQWLGQAIELPDNGAFWQPTRFQADETSAVVTASFRVNSRGRAREVQTNASSQEESRFASRLRRQLQATYFRPRFEEGEAVESDIVQRQYRVYD